MTLLTPAFGCHCFPNLHASDDSSAVVTDPVTPADFGLSLPCCLSCAFEGSEIPLSHIVAGALNQIVNPVFSVHCSNEDAARDRLRPHTTTLGIFQQQERCMGADVLHSEIYYKTS